MKILNNYKIKNKKREKGPAVKYILALAMIAILAMVSVAAIAVHSGSSDAESTYWNMGSGNTLIIDGTSTVDYNFTVDVTPDVSNTYGECPIVITSLGNYTGTLTIGTLDKSTTPYTYTPYAAIKLTNASNVKLEAALDTGTKTAVFFIGNTGTDAQVLSDGTYELTDGVPSGTYQLIQGSVQLGLGNWSGQDFNGTVTAGSFSVTSEYTSGVTLSLAADGTALLSGYAYNSAMDAPAAPAGVFYYPTPTLSFSGTASLQFSEAEQTALDKYGINTNDVFSTSGIEVTIEDGAVITAGDRAPSLAESVVVDGIDITDGILVSADGTPYPGTPDGTGSFIKFDFVPLGTYSLFMAANSGNVYWATAVVSATGISLGVNTLPANLMDNGAFTSGGPDLTYDASAYIFKSAVDLSTMEAGTVTVDVTSHTGSIGFYSGFCESTDQILAVMWSIADNQYQVFWGHVSTNYATGTLSATTGALIDATKIKGDSVTISPAIATFTVRDDSVIHIYGELNFLYASYDQYGSFNISNNAYINLDADGGMIIQGVQPPAVGSRGEQPVDTIFASANFVSAYYYVNDPATGTATSSTYYFTSLVNAIGNSSYIFLVGNPFVVIKDTMIFGTTVHVSAGSFLQVGDDDNNAILAVAEGGALVNENIGSQGINVYNGQIVYTADNAPALGSYNEPASDVKIIRGSNVIYTDLGTALNTLSQSGDTVLFLRDSLLNSDATVKAGVTLQDAPGATIIIPVDKALTVQGTVNIDNDGAVNGVLYIANGGKVSITSDVGLYGAVEVQSGGVLALTSGSFYTTSLAIFDGGSVTLVDSYLGVDSLFMITGTGVAASLSIDNTSVFEVNTDMMAGTAPSASNDNGNTAEVTGKVTLNVNAVATVYGNSAINIGNFTAGTTSSTFWIGSNIFQTVYVNGNAVSLLPALYPILKDGQISDWNNDQMLNGIWLSYFLTNPTGPSVGESIANHISASVPSDWTNLYAKFTPKMCSVTLAFSPGVTWTVNGIKVDGGNNPQSVALGSSITVQAFVDLGYEGTPIIQMNGVPVSNPYTTTTVGDVIFSIKDGSVRAAGSGGYTEIRTFEDLMAINTNSTTLGEKYTLMNDIAFTAANNASFIPIGSSASPFTGTFDGNGHEISGMNVNISSSSGSLYAGLFGDVSGAEIYDLGVVGSTVRASSLSSGAAFVGGIVGCATQSTIQNCYNTGDVSVTIYPSSLMRNAYVGGIVGMQDASTVQDCSNAGDVSVAVNPVSSYGCAGGIVGSASGNGTIQNCCNTGTVSLSASSANAGGIAGVTGTVNNCCNTGNVSDTSVGGTAYAGGIAGSATTANNCYNTGNVSSNSSQGTAYAGGIFGYSASAASTSNCYFLTGTVSCNAVSGDKIYGYLTNPSSFLHDGGTGDQASGAKTMEQMTPTIQDAKGNVSIYYAGSGGWDFSDGGVWTIISGVNNGYPILSSLDYIGPDTTPSYNVTLTSGTGYTLTPVNDSSSPVESGGSFSFTMTVDPEYAVNHVVKVMVNGILLTPVGDVYTITNITEDKTVTVAFDPIIDSSGVPAGGSGVEISGTIDPSSGATYVKIYITFSDGSVISSTLSIGMAGDFFISYSGSMHPVSYLVTAYDGKPGTSGVNMIAWTETNNI